MSFGRLRISPGFFVVITVFYLLDTQGMLWKVLLCCAIHEAGHAIAVRLCGGRIESLSLGATGAALTARYPRASYAAEMIVTAAGGVAGFLAAVIFSALGWYILSGISLALTVFNFLPIRPLDGGQLLAQFFSVLKPPGEAEKWSVAADIFFSLLFSGLSLWLYLKTGAGFELLLLAGALSIGAAGIKKEKRLAF